MSEDGGAATTPARRATSRARSDSRTPGTALAALIAWATTVAPSALGRTAPWIATALGFAAVLAGVAGATLLATRPRLARHVGLDLFLGLDVAVWLTSSTTLHPLRLDPIRGVIGAVAWGVFALSWSERATASEHARPPDADAPTLQARAGLAGMAVPVTTAGVLGGIALLGVAWSITDPSRSLLAHAVSVVCAVAFCSSAATLATTRPRKAPREGRHLTSQAVRALALLAVAIIAGIALLVAR